MLHGRAATHEQNGQQPIKKELYVFATFFCGFSNFASCAQDMPIFFHNIAPADGYINDSHNNRYYYEYFIQ
jgi:hypothetical protein